MVLTTNWSQDVSSGSWLSAARIRVPYASAYLRQKVLSLWEGPRLSVEEFQ